MGEADQRAAEVGVVGKQIAGADAGHPLEDLVLEFRLLFRRDKHPGAVGRPDRAVKVGHHGNIGGEVEVGIIGDNQRRFAAQLHGDLFSDEVQACHHFFAAGDAAGEGDFGDVRMLGQILAGFRADPQDVKHPVRQPASLYPASLRAVSGVTSLGLKSSHCQRPALAPICQGDLDR